MRKHHLNEELTAMSDNLLLAADAIRKIPQHALHLDKFQGYQIQIYSPCPVSTEGYLKTQTHSVICGDVLTWLALIPPTEHFQFRQKYDHEGIVTRQQYSEQIFPLIPCGTYAWDFLFGIQWLDHDKSVDGAAARLEYASTLDSPAEFFADMLFNPEMYKQHRKENRHE